MRVWSLEWWCLLYLGVLVLVWLLGEVVGEVTPATLLLTYAPPLLFAWPAPALLLLALWRPRARPVLLALLACALALVYAGLNLHLPTRDVGLRVLSFNVARGGLSSPERVAATIRSVNPDVVTLQEVNGLRAGFLQGLKDALPEYRVVALNEVATFTRLPLLAQRDVTLDAGGRHALVTDLRWQDRRLRVVNVHLWSVQVTAAMRGRLGASEQARDRQLNALMALIAAAPDPLVVAGDFNTPPRGRDYRRLEGALTDAFGAVGVGFGLSFPSALPLWRIDHVFMRGVQPLSARVLPPGGSDHRPLLAVLRPER